MQRTPTMGQAATIVGVGATLAYCAYKVSQVVVDDQRKTVSTRRKTARMERIEVQAQREWGLHLRRNGSEGRTEAQILLELKADSGLYDRPEVEYYELNEGYDFLSDSTSSGEMEWRGRFVMGDDCGVGENEPHTTYVVVVLHAMHNVLTGAYT